MKSLSKFILIAMLAALSACHRPNAEMVEVGKTYRFYFDSKSEWIESKVLNRTKDGWILIDLGGMWINGNQLKIITEPKEKS